MGLGLGSGLGLGLGSRPAESSCSAMPSGPLAERAATCARHSPATPPLTLSCSRSVACSSAPLRLRTTTTPSAPPVATYNPSAEVASAVARLPWCSHVASAGAGCSLAGSAASRQPSLNWYARSAPSAHAAKKERPPVLWSASPAGTGASASAADSG